MQEIRLNFCGWEDIPPGFLNRALVGRGAEITKNHLASLRELARKLGVTNHALANAEALATGYSDLIVVLQGPCNTADEVPYLEMVSRSPALPRLDESLQSSSLGERTLENTIVIYVKPFRSNRIRKAQIRNDREGCWRDDAAAYQAFQGMIHLLSPEALVICQIEFYEEQNPMSNMSSTFGESGKQTRVHTRVSKSSIKVASLHPKWRQERNERKGRRASWKERRDLRQLLFESTLVVAASALIGRRVVEFELDKFENPVLHSVRDVSTDEPICWFQLFHDEVVAEGASTPSLEAVEFDSVVGDDATSLRICSTSTYMDVERG